MTATTERTWEIEQADFRRTGFTLTKHAGEWIEYAECEELIEGRWEGFVSIRRVTRDLLGTASEYRIGK